MEDVAIDPKFKQFLKKCSPVLNDENVVKLGEKRYRESNPHYVRSSEFSSLLDQTEQKILNDPNHKYVYFKELVTELKAYKNKSTPKHKEKFRKRKHPDSEPDSADSECLSKQLKSTSTDSSRVHSVPMPGMTKGPHIPSHSKQTLLTKGPHIPSHSKQTLLNQSPKLVKFSSSTLIPSKSNLKEAQVQTGKKCQIESNVSGSTSKATNASRSLGDVVKRLHTSRGLCHKSMRGRPCESVPHIDLTGDCCTEHKEISARVGEPKRSILHDSKDTGKDGAVSCGNLHSPVDSQGNESDCEIIDTSPSSTLKKTLPLAPITPPVRRIAVIPSVGDTSATLKDMSPKPESGNYVSSTSLTTQVLVIEEDSQTILVTENDDFSNTSNIISTEPGSKSDKPPDQSKRSTSPTSRSEEANDQSEQSTSLASKSDAPLNQSEDKTQAEIKKDEPLDKSDRRRTASAEQMAKLEKLLGDTSKAIQKLEERELSLDDLDSEESSYLLEERLKKRFVKIWDKLCEVKGRKNTTGRATQQRFHFNGTRFPEINQKIEKFVNKKKIFPDYQDVLKLIKKTNLQRSLGLGHNQVQDLAREAFTDIGNSLQERRHQDFVDNFGGHLTKNYKMRDDPAWYDKELKKKLDEHKAEAKSKMEEVLTKFTNKQYDNPRDEDEDEGQDEEEAGSDEENSANEDEGDIEQELQKVFTNEEADNILGIADREEKGKIPIDNQHEGNRSEMTAVHKRSTEHIIRLDSDDTVTTSGECFVDRQHSVMEEPGRESCDTPRLNGKLAVKVVDGTEDPSNKPGQKEKMDRIELSPLEAENLISSSNLPATDDSNDVIVLSDSD